MSVEELFHETLQRPPDERAAFLDEACRGDDALRRRVEILLGAHASPGSFLASPAADLNATIDQPPAAEGPGTVVGPYKLLEQIGEGGFGVVFLAEQTAPVRRKVALKILKPGMDTRQVVARFEAERQALAIMDHPHIARVFDGGATLSGRPYFVMELVKGVPITEYCDQHHLTPRQRLELFVSVCQAVQHAHQKGIIHRDLKPSNVLVSRHDTTPVVKVIDFGVAKALGQELTDKTLFTGVAQMIGTPLYMSPEQAGMSDLDVDTRSDIYSLGVLLYELLTGTTPFPKERFRKAAYDEIRRIIREEEPPKPSTRLSDSTASLPSISALRHTEPARLAKLVRGELDWIVMKALEKDRARRYETANGFAADVQRYLADEAVQACPPSVGYRLRKFARRNKGGLAAAGLVLFFVVLLGGGIGWMMRDRAARHAKFSGQVEVILAELDQLAKEQKWPEALAAARRAEAVVAGGEADAPTAERVRDRLRGLEFIDRLDQVRMEAATLVEGKFNVAGTDREYARAFRHYGVDIDELPVEASIDRLKARPALAIPLATALDHWAGARRKVSEKDAAGWQRLVAIARGIDPDPLRDRLRSIWVRPVSEVHDDLRQLADSINIRAQHPVTMLSLSQTLLWMGHADSAIRLLRDVRTVYPGDFWVNFELGSAAGERKDHEEAVRFLTAAVSIRPNSVAALNNLGVALGGQKKLDEAVACYRKAIELDPKYAAAHNNLGGALREQKKLDEAVACYRKAIELDTKSVPAHNNLGVALREQKKLDEAVACYRKAIELDPKYAATHYGLGIVLKEQGELTQAIVAFERVIELEPDHAQRHNELAWLLVTSPDPGFRDAGRAVALARRAVELDRSNWQNHNTLGVAHYRAGDWAAAIAALEKSMELRAGGDGFDWFFLAMARWRQGETAPAREWYDRAARWMAANRPADGELRRFRLEAQELLGIRDHRPMPGHADAVRSVAFFPDGGRALSAGHDKTLRLWDLDGGKELHRFEGHAAAVYSAAVSPDGRRALSGATDRTMRLWDVEAKKELRRFDHPEEWVTCVAFSPDGRLGLCGTQHTVHLWDLESGKELRQFKGHAGAVRSVAFSADGRVALSGGHDKTVRLWDVATGNEVRRFAGHTHFVLTVALSPDGRLAASGGCDRTVRVWEVGTGKELYCLLGHEGNVEGLAFARDGRRAVSGGTDGTIRQWDLASGRVLHCAGTEDVLGVALSPDGRKVLSAHADHGVRLWVLPEPGKELPESGKDPER